MCVGKGRRETEPETRMCVSFSVQGRAWIGAGWASCLCYITCNRTCGFLDAGVEELVPTQWGLNDIFWRSCHLGVSPFQKLSFAKGSHAIWWVGPLARIPDTLRFSRSVTVNRVHCLIFLWVSICKTRRACESLHRCVQVSLQCIIWAEHSFCVK